MIHKMLTNVTLMPKISFIIFQYTRADLSTYQDRAEGKDNSDSRIEINQVIMSG